MGIETPAIKITAAIEHATQPTRYMGIETAVAIPPRPTRKTQPTRYMGIETSICYKSN